jgi:thiol-disulfide isomerase/thioredoxin
MVIPSIYNLISFGQLGDVPSFHHEYAKERKIKYQFVDLNNKKYKADNLKGKIVIIDCWATWCKPCQKGIPELINIKDKYGEKVELIGISFDKSLEIVNNYLKNNKVGMLIKYPIILGADNANQFYDVSVLPTTFILDKDGYLRYQYVGYTQQEMIESHLNKLLTEK